jgi:hypothetical protein
MYIPTNLRMYRIMGRNRREPCKCGHFHSSREVFISENNKDLLDVVSFGRTLWEVYTNRYEKNSPWGQIILRRAKK